MTAWAYPCVMLRRWVHSWNVIRLEWGGVDLVLPTKWCQWFPCVQPARVNTGQRQGKNRGLHREARLTPAPGRGDALTTLSMSVHPAVSSTPNGQKQEGGWEHTWIPAEVVAKPHRRSAGHTSKTRRVPTLTNVT